MSCKKCVPVFVLLVSFTSAKVFAKGAEPSDPAVSESVASEPVIFEQARSEPMLRTETVREQGTPVMKADACADSELQPNWMPPTWNIQAGSEQCGALETDNLTILTPMGQGVAQWTIATTAKYGFSPRLEVRWGLPGRIYQYGGGTQALRGTTDQWLGALYHFRDQAGWVPDLAVDYAVKIPTANPAKGFGSGYVDQILTFIVSRDFGPNHVDFNVAGTLAGTEGGKEGAAQLGLGLTRSLKHNLFATFEAYGGPQPGTSDRYGAVFLGGSWGVRPSLAINGGSVYSYTAGSPRFEHILGLTYTVRPGIIADRGSRLSRLLGH